MIFFFFFSAISPFSLLDLLKLKSMAQGTYLAVQWLRARLLMHKTQVQSLVRKLSCRAAKPAPHSYWALALHSPHATTGENRELRGGAWVPQRKILCATTKTPCSQTNNWSLQKKREKWMALSYIYQHGKPHIILNEDSKLPENMFSGIPYVKFKNMENILYIVKGYVYLRSVWKHS